jgi:CDP-diacylglycerol--serine O-phosphatidyltransferase
MKKYIPNSITILNLLCGTMALLMIFRDRWGVAVALVLVAALLDFMDGFIARLLKEESDVGKQLDSLADIVSFGLVPAAFVYSILQSQFDIVSGDSLCSLPWVSCGMLISILIIPAFSAIRLARFNAAGPSDFFTGLPTPAHALFWTGIYYEVISTGTLFGQQVYVWFIWAIMLLFSMLLIVPLPMLSLKFRDSSFRNNQSRYIILGLAVIILLTMQLPGLPLIILTYILLSLFRFLIT